jgi:hypothetical protein
MAEKVSITFQPAKKKFRKDNFCRGLEIGKIVQLFTPIVLECNLDTKKDNLNRPAVAWLESYLKSTLHKSVAANSYALAHWQKVRHGSL